MTGMTIEKSQLARIRKKEKYLVFVIARGVGKKLHIYQALINSTLFFLQLLNMIFLSALNVMA